MGKLRSLPLALPPTPPKLFPTSWLFLGLEGNAERLHGIALIRHSVEGVDSHECGFVVRHLHESESLASSPFVTRLSHRVHLEEEEEEEENGEEDKEK